MTASGVDRIVVTAQTIQDAPDIARREWEREGLRMVDKEPRVYRTAMLTPNRWVVEAKVEVIR